MYKVAEFDGVLRWPVRRFWLAQKAVGGRLIEQCFSGEYNRASWATLDTTYKVQVCGLHQRM